MEQKTYLALTAMLNSFPQTTGNVDLTLRTFEGVLRGSSSEAVSEAAQRFTSGLVKDQSLKFAPSVAEFAAEVRSVEETHRLRDRPRLPAPTYQRGTLRPFEVAQAKAKRAHEHLPVLIENVSYDEWRRLSAERRVPTGAVWVAALATVYGPEK